MPEYIEREKVLSKAAPVEGCFSDMISAYDVIMLPAADVAPVRHGCWERVIPSKSAAKWSTKVSCSNCHSAGYAHHKYCPNCGAKMDMRSTVNNNANKEIG